MPGGFSQSPLWWPMWRAIGTEEPQVAAGGLSLFCSLVPDPALLIVALARISHQLRREKVPAREHGREGNSLRRVKSPLFSRVWRKLHAKARQLIQEMWGNRYFDFLAGAARMGKRLRISTNRRFLDRTAKHEAAKHEFGCVCRHAPGSQSREVLLASLVFRFALFMPQSGYASWRAGQLPDKKHNVFESNTLHNKRNVGKESVRGDACPRFTPVTKASAVWSSASCDAAVAWIAAHVPFRPAQPRPSHRHQFKRSHQPCQNVTTSTRY